MNYIVAAVGPWNFEICQKRLKALPGRWHFVADPQGLNSALLEMENPRYIFFIHWRWHISEDVFNTYECVGFHMTDLPYGRGGSPLQNLIKAGHKNTVLTAFKIESGMDTGPVYIKEPLKLRGSAEDIFVRTSNLSWDIIKKIITSNPIPIPQVGPVVEFSRRKPSDSRLPKDKNLEVLYDHIRMLDAPGYPMAFLEAEGIMLYFQNAKLKHGKLTASVTFDISDKNNG